MHHPRPSLLGLLGLLGCWTAAPARAASADELATLRYLLDSGRAAEVAGRTAEGLAAAPEDLALVGLHARAMAALGEGPSLVGSIDPSAGAAATVAWTLAALHGLSEPEGTCATVDRHLATLESAAAWAALVPERARLDRVCPDWSARWWAQATPRLDGTPLGLSLRVGAADAAWGEAVEAWVRAGPIDLTRAGNPWAPEASGLGLVRARVALAAAAEAAAASSDPTRLWWAREVWRWQGRETTALDAAVRAADPDAWEAGWSTSGAVRWQPPEPPGPAELVYRLQEVAGITDPDRRATALRTLDARLPADGPLRAGWWTLRAELAHAADRPRAEVRAREQAWRADPSDADLANHFAWAAATHQLRMDVALEAIDAALATPAGYRADRGGPAADPTHRWSEGHAVGARLDTRGWLRFRLGDLPGARADLDRALMLYRSPSGTVHFHAGLVAHAAGDAEAALFHLREGFAVVDARHDAPELVSEARAVVQTLYTTHRWHPDGVEGWLRARSREAAAGTRGEPLVDLDRFATALVDAPPTLPVQGGPMPELMLDVGGSATALAEVEGWRIVELWAAWCASCHVQVGAMIELHAELAAAGVPVTVVILSVEDEPRPRWPEGLVGRPQPGWVVAWGGPSVVDRVGTPGLPATLLVDPTGRVVDSRSGWEGDLGWLRAALDASGVSAVSTTVE